MIELFYNNVLLILNDDKYFEDSYESIDLNLELCKTMVQSSDEPFDFYVYWIGRNVHDLLEKQNNNRI